MKKDEYVIRDLTNKDGFDPLGYTSSLGNMYVVMLSFLWINQQASGL